MQLLALQLAIGVFDYVDDANVKRMFAAEVLRLANTSKVRKHAADVLEEYPLIAVWAHDQ